MATQMDMVKYINIARQFPAYFVSLVNNQLQSFITDKELPINEEMIYETNEGKKLWVETKQFLEKQTSLAPFEVHQGLNLSAKSHAQDLAITSTFGHTGSDKSTFSQRILKYCRKGQGGMAQIIGADFHLEGRNSAEMTILGLIIDDGVSDRGHRKTIFNPSYRYIGCKSEIQGDKVITVFNLTQNKLPLRSQQSSTSEDYQYGTSTMPSLKQPKASNTMNFNRTQNDNFSKDSKPRNNFQKPIFEQLSQNLAQLKPSMITQKPGNIKMQGRVSKKIRERKQNTKIYYEQGSKITEKHTEIYYTDGTMQENIERHTVYS